MATKVFRFYGKSHYAKVHTPDEKYGNYQCGLIFDKASLDLFRKSGLQLKLKDVDGEQYATFRREPRKLIRGDMVEFGKPKVTDAVGREIDDLVGNGSLVALTISVYDTIKGKGHRIDEVRVNQLVPYGKDHIEDAHGDYDDDGEYVREGAEVVRDAPPPVRAKPGKAVPVAPGDAEELPF